MRLNYCLLVTGPAYGTQQAISAYQFAHALLSAGHSISSVFFYREGVLNANRLVSPASDECDLTRCWVELAKVHGVVLNVCVAAALRRGVIDDKEAQRQGLDIANMQEAFSLSGLGELAQAVLICDRIVQF